MFERQKLRVIVQLLFFVFILRTNGNQMPAWGSYKHSEIVLLILQYAVKIIIALSIFHWFLKELLTYYLKEPPYKWSKMKCRFETPTISINAVKITLLFQNKQGKWEVACHACAVLSNTDVKWMQGSPWTTYLYMIAHSCNCACTDFYFTASKFMLCPH